MKSGLVLVGLLICLPTWAAIDLGDVAEMAMVPTYGFAKAANLMAILLGAGFLFSAIGQYKQYRHNSQAVRISNPLTLFVLGWVLIAMPLLANYTESGAFLR